MKLTGNTILITGAGSGIGLALAEAFVKLDNRVIVAARSPEKLKVAKSRGLETIKADCIASSVSPSKSKFRQSQAGSWWAMSRNMPKSMPPGSVARPGSSHPVSPPGGDGSRRASPGVGPDRARADARMASQESMIAIDTNLLVYAHRASTPQHSLSRAALEKAAADRRRWGIAAPCLVEFWSTVTHPAVNH